MLIVAAQESLQLRHLGLSVCACACLTLQLTNWPSQQTKPRFALQRGLSMFVCVYEFLLVSWALLAMDGLMAATASAAAAA